MNTSRSFNLDTEDLFFQPLRHAHRPVLTTTRTSRATARTRTRTRTTSRAALLSSPARPASRPTTPSLSAREEPRPLSCAVGGWEDSSSQIGRVEFHAAMYLVVSYAKLGGSVYVWSLCVLGRLASKTCKEESHGDATASAELRALGLRSSGKFRAAVLQEPGAIARVTRSRRYCLRLRRFSPFPSIFVHWVQQTFFPLR